MEVPQTRYAKSGAVSIAYQVVGEGPFDVVLVPGFVSNVEYGWEDPHLAAFLRSLSSFCRLILFDKRGTGLSDRVRGVPTLETRMDDVRAIMDDAGSERAVVIGYSEGASMAVLFGTTYPDRTIALVMYGGLLTWDWMAERRFEIRHESDQAALEEIERRWGTPAYCDELLAEDAPSMLGDAAFRRWYAARLRLSASPRAAFELQRMNVETDTRGIVGAIRVPTLILHRAGDRNVDVKNARYAAERIPGSRFVELPGDDHLPWIGDSDTIVREIEAFSKAAWAAGLSHDPDRVLATVLFTDIVDSTTKAVELGDAHWRDLVSEHHARVRRELAVYRGRELDTAGDGFFASFDGPARAIHCACAIRDAVHDIGLGVRAGLHTGECELIDGKAGGVAVITGARIAALGGAGDVLVSSTVRDLVAGSGIQLEDQGSRALKGLPEERQIYRVVSARGDG